jgi:hypothetical protein
MNMKIDKDPDRCLVTLTLDKADLFEVTKGVLNLGLAQICTIEEAPTLSVEEQPALRRLC